MPNNEKSLDVIVCDVKNQSRDEQEDQGVECSSGPPSITYSGDNEEEYLRSTFTRLGVGLDGYLSLEELTKVCHAIGMDKMAAEIIDQLFCRLDVDGDGRISFEEFLHMFQNGGPDTSQPLTLDDSLTQDSSLVSSTSCLPSVGSTGMLVTEFGIFSTLDPEGSGYISVSRLTDAWFSVGMRDGVRLLRELGLPHKRDAKVNLRDLGVAMEEELRLQQDSSPVPRQAALLTLLHEIKGLRASVESARGERDKFRWDLGEANHRISLFAQELDEQHATMERNTQRQLSELERQYKEQVRDLQELLNRERENGRENALSDSRELLALNSRLQDEDLRLKSRVASLEKDIKKLEVENLEQSSKLIDSKSCAVAMEKQVTELKRLREKVAEYESSSPREDEFRRLVSRVEELVKENQKLRDSNDELIAQLDAFGSRHAVGRHEDYSLDGSCIGDYLDNSSTEGTLGGVKRRGGSSPTRKSSPEEGNSDDDESPRGSKIRKKSSNKIHFHYLDVTSHDESFCDGNLNDTHPPLGLILPKPTLTSTPAPQPLSLPLYLAKTADRSTVENKMKVSSEVTTPESSLILQKNVLRIIAQDLEKEVEDLKKEKELMTIEILKLSQQLEKRSDTLESSFKSDLEVSLSNSSPRLTSSTPKSIVRFRQKCPSCLELESRLNVALEELEMALKREKQNLTDKSEDHNAAMNRMQILIDHCQELEEELAQMKANVMQLVQEKNQLQIEKEKWSTNSSNSQESTVHLIKSLFHELVSKLKRRRTRSFSSIADCASASPGTLGGARDGIPTIIEEEEEEDEDIADHSKTVMDHVGYGIDSLIKMEISKIEREASSMEESWSRERDLLEKQKALAEDRLNKAEQDYQVLKAEYEKSEDYWHMKFQEEVDYYEEERKLYDEKFQALETKIKEYEEMALSSSGGPVEVPGPTTDSAIEGFSDDSEDRLSTIDESAVWERQVTELEDEVKCLQKKLRECFEEKENIEISLSKKLAAEQRFSAQEISRLKTELEHTKVLCRSLEVQMSAAREELECSSKNLMDSASPARFFPDNKANGVGVDACAEARLQAHDEVGDHLGTSNGLNISSSTSNEVAMNGALKAQLSKYQKRTKQLEHLLRITQKSSSELINQSNEKHNAEIQSLQSMMTSSQHLFTSNLSNFKDQLSKVVRGDLLVRELYMENAQLMLALQITEERQKEAEEQLRKLQMVGQIASIGLSHSKI